jgi:hypothetical protein
MILPSGNQTWLEKKDSLLKAIQKEFRWVSDSKVALMAGQIAVLKIYPLVM